MRNLLFLLFLFVSSHVSANNQKTTESFAHLVPEGFIILEEIKGDLNKDNQNDVVLLVQGTDKAKIVDYKYLGKRNLNRRGIIIAFKDKNKYTVILKKTQLFFSEDTTDNYPPELSLYIEKGKLYINYYRGRYGNWTYNFRYQNSEFQLIGFNKTENQGPVTNFIASINFMTKKMFIKKNIDAETGDENFKETWHNFSLPKLLSLNEIDEVNSLYDKVYSIYEDILKSYYIY